MVNVLYPPSLLNQQPAKGLQNYNLSISANGPGNVDGATGMRHIVSIPPGSGAIIEAVFPEEGFYFGNDHDLASILYGSGFVVSARDTVPP